MKKFLHHFFGKNMLRLRRTDFVNDDSGMLKNMLSVGLSMGFMFTVFGQTMATYCGQNIGAGKVERVKKGIWLSIFYTCIWCTLAIVASYTIGPWLVYMVTGSHNEVVITNATNYLKFDTLFYYVTAVICVVRNAMQGLGEQITPLVSSSLEMIGKIVIAFTLVPMLGYTGVIVAEPLVWFIMVIPLIIKIFRMPVLHKTQEVNSIHNLKKNGIKKEK